MAERVHVMKNSVFVDHWDYHKPSLIPDEEGNIKLIFQACFGPCEWWEWSMDAQGKFWMEYKWCENDFYEDDNFKEEISKEKMIEKIQSMQRFFAEQGGAGVCGSISRCGGICEGLSKGQKLSQ